MKLALWRFMWLLSVNSTNAVLTCSLLRCFRSKSKEEFGDQNGSCSDSNVVSEKHQNSGSPFAQPLLSSETAEGALRCRTNERPDIPEHFQSRRSSDVQKLQSWKEESDVEVSNHVQVVSLNSAATWCAQKMWKKMLLIVAILLCLATAVRVLVIIGHIILDAAEDIAQDFPHYQKGAQRRVEEVQGWVADLSEKEFGRRMQLPVANLLKTQDLLLNYVKSMTLSVLPAIFQHVPQCCLSVLFVVFLLFCPVKAEGPRKEVLELCSDFVKVKSIISTVLGFCVGLSLKLCNLELYYAAGLLVAVANFVPNGALVCSIVPCIFAFFDDRKHLHQVITAAILQIALINGFAFIIEPIFIGGAVDMHPIPTILGVTFFGYVWGVPGMLISIPVLGTFRLALVAFARKARGEERSTIRSMQHFLEGRWTAASELPEEDQVYNDLYSNPSDPSGGVLHQGQASSIPGNIPEAHAEVEASSTLHSALQMLRERYQDRKVLLDGLLYFGLVFFLFSPWSDYVFGFSTRSLASESVGALVDSSNTKWQGNSSR